MLLSFFSVLPIRRITPTSAALRACVGMGDFNSSDLEFSSPEDEAPRRGKRAIASIVQQSIVDRVQSKKTVKTLKAVANAPSTDIARQYWYDIFTHFAVTTLRIDSRPK